MTVTAQMASTVTVVLLSRGPAHTNPGQHQQVPGLRCLSQGTISAATPSNITTEAK